MLEPCAYIYNTCTLCGVPLMPKMYFPDFRMPPKKRKLREISHETKGVGRLYNNNNIYLNSNIQCI